MSDIEIGKKLAKKDDTETAAVIDIVKNMIINKKVHDALEYPNYEDEVDVRRLGRYFDLDYDAIDTDEDE